MAKLIIDLSGRNGLIEKHFQERHDLLKKSNRRYGATPGQVAEGLYNPFRSPGYLSPTTGDVGAGIVNITASAGTISARMFATENDIINRDIYIAEQGEQVWALDTYDATTVSVQVDLTSLTTASIKDLQIYELNGTPKLFYSFEAAGQNDDVGEITLPAKNFAENNNWLSTDVTGAFTVGNDNQLILMEVADNGFMYISEDFKVHKVDGTTSGGANGTVTEAVLTFPQTFHIIDMADARGLLWIAITGNTSINYFTETAQFSPLAGVFIWDRFSTVARMRDYFPINGIQRIVKLFYFQGAMYCFCRSSNGFGEIRKFDGNSFEIVKELGYNAEPSLRDSVVVEGSFVTWQGRDGNFYAYGRDFSISQNNVLYSLGHVDSSDDGVTATNLRGGVIIPGSIGTTDGTREAYYFSFDSTTEGNVIRKWYPFGEGTIDSKSQVASDNEIKYPIEILSKLSDLKSITIFFPVGSGSGTTTEMTVKIYKNNSTTEELSFTLDRNDGARGYKFQQLDIRNVNNFQVGIAFAANTIAEATTITPSHCEVEYDVTTKIK